MSISIFTFQKGLIFFHYKCLTVTKFFFFFKERDELKCIFMEINFMPQMLLVELNWYWIRIFLWYAIWSIFYFVSVKYIVYIHFSFNWCAVGFTPPWTVSQRSVDQGSVSSQWSGVLFPEVLQWSWKATDGVFVFSHACISTFNHQLAAPLHHIKRLAEACSYSWLLILGKNVLFHHY